MTSGHACGSGLKRDSETERLNYTPGSKVGLRVKERIHIIQELQHCSKKGFFVAPGNAGPTCSFFSRRSELQVMTLIASNATVVLL